MKLKISKTPARTIGAQWLVFTEKEEILEIIRPLVDLAILEKVKATQDYFLNGRLVVSVSSTMICVRRDFIDGN